MGCCGKGKNGARSGRKPCSKCGWATFKLQKYDRKTKTTKQWYVCTNALCKTKEEI